jgi:hypothetical protein
MDGRRIAAALVVALGVAGSAAAQDPRVTVESMTKRLLQHRRLVADGCDNCGASGIVNQKILDERGLRTKPVACPDCEGSGLHLEESMIAKVREAYWKPTLHPPMVWPGRSGYGKEQYRKYPKEAAYRLGLAFAAGWIVDDSAIEKVGEYELVDGVGHIEVKIRGDAPPRSLQWFQFKDGWKLVPEADAEAALTAARLVSYVAPGGKGAATPRAAGSADKGERTVADNQRPVTKPGTAPRCRVNRQHGNWRQDGEVLILDAREKPGYVHFADQLIDYDLTYRFKIEEASRPTFEFRTLLHLEGADSMTRVVFERGEKVGGLAGAFAEAIPARAGETAAIRGATARLKLEVGREYAVRIAVRGAKVKVEIDGVQYLVFESKERFRGSVGFSAGAVRAAISDLRVAEPSGTVKSEGAQLVE